MCAALLRLLWAGRSLPVVDSRRQGPPCSFWNGGQPLSRSRCWGNRLLASSVKGAPIMEPNARLRLSPRRSSRYGGVDDPRVADLRLVGAEAVEGVVSLAGAASSARHPATGGTTFSELAPLQTSWCSWAPGRLWRAYSRDCIGCHRRPRSSLGLVGLRAPWVRPHSAVVLKSCEQFVADLHQRVVLAQNAQISCAP